MLFRAGWVVPVDRPPLRDAAVAVEDGRVRWVGAASEAPAGEVRDLGFGRYERGFDYERNFGGALYLFMKGMRPGNATGVFFEQPPVARMRALDQAFGGSSW